MASTNKHNLDWMCRTCMQELVEVSSFDANTSTQQQWQHIADTVEECGSLRITELISNTILHLEVQLSDELPKKICRACLQSFISAHRFQQTCVKSQQTFHALISKQNAHLTMSLTKASEDAFVKQDTLLEPKTEGFDFEYVNASTELEQLGVDQSNNDLIEHYLNSQDELSEFLKNEPCDDGEWKVGDSAFVTNELCNNDHTDNDEINSTDAVDNKVLLVEVEEAPAILDKPTLNCSLCNKSFKQMRYLRAHLKRHKKPNESNEQVADDEPSAESSVGAIVANEARDDDNCLGDRNNVTVPSADTLRSNISVEEIDGQQISLGSSAVQCHLCPKTFNHKQYLTKHLDWHRKINILQPEHNEDVDLSLLDKSRREHVCDLCDRSFCSNYSLTRHKKVMHSRDKPNNLNKRINTIACKRCHQNFCTSFSLIRHIKSQHSTEKTNQVEVKPIVCDFCKKIFKFECELKHHLKYVHTSERPFKCSECSKAFKSQCTLQAHILRHREDKSYECPYCPQRFTCRAYMAKHKNRHAEFKKFLCDVCAKGFGTSQQLRFHKMMHSSERPHKCDFCELRFVRRDHKRTHMRTHTGEKPYKCEYCDRAYAQSNDHIKHLRTHLGDNVYGCELCPLKFRLASELRLHFASHKNDDEETRERNMKALKEEEEKLRLKLVGNDTETAVVNESK